MLQPRCTALRAVSRSYQRSLQASTLDDLARLTLSTHTSVTTQLNQHRHASHATQGRANGPAQGPGKRLGAKRAASELVVPGCILFRQRGAKWWPGENCVMGRDHTISSLVKGYVRYYRDPENHPKRKLIGVVFEQDEKLPRGRNMSRRRRLGMEPRVMEVVAEEVPIDNAAPPKPEFKSGYQYRPSNAEIGLAAKQSGRNYPVYKPHDRWLAWRLRLERKEKAVERRALMQRTSAKGKKANKVAKKVAKTAPTPA